MSGIYFSLHVRMMSVRTNPSEFVRFLCRLVAMKLLCLVSVCDSGVLCGGSQQRAVC